MKRIFVFFAVLSLLALCACGASASSVPAPTDRPMPEAPAETPVPTEAPAEPEADEAPELSELLAEIGGRMHPGTAGSSLTSLELGAMLLDWSLQTDMDEAQIRAAVGEFLAPMSHPDRSTFALQMREVKSAAERLRTGDAAAMMEDIGGTDGTLWPWDNAPLEKLDALFEAAGANDRIADPNE